MADVNPNGSPQSKLQVFQAQASPFQTNFVDDYMKQLAQAMSGAGQAPGGANDYNNLLSQLGLGTTPGANGGAGGSGDQYDANGYRIGNNFDSAFHHHQVETINVDPSDYDAFLHSPEGQAAINAGKIINPTPGGTAGSGSNPGNPSLPSAKAQGRAMMVDQWNKINKDQPINDWAQFMKTAKGWSAGGNPDSPQNQQTAALLKQANQYL